MVSISIPEVLTYNLGAVRDLEYLSFLLVTAFTLEIKPLESVLSPYLSSVVFSFPFSFYISLILYFGSVFYQFILHLVLTFIGFLFADDYFYKPNDFEICELFILLLYTSGFMLFLFCITNEISFTSI